MIGLTMKDDGWYICDLSPCMTDDSWMVDEGSEKGPFIGPIQALEHDDDTKYPEGAASCPVCLACHLDAEHAGYCCPDEREGEEED